MDLVSVIVPIFNAENYIDKCLESLFNQSYTNIEILLIDDGSTDRSIEICQKYVNKSSKFKLFSKSNGGVASARNFGLKHMNDKGYVIFVDPDDYVNQSYILELVRCLKKNENSMIACKWNFEDETGNTLCYFEEDKKENIFSCEQGYLCILDEKKVSGYVWNKLFLKKIILQNDIQFNEHISITEDLLFCIHYYKYVNKLVLINKNLYNYIYHSSSTCWSNDFNKSKFLSQLYSLNIVVECIPERYSEAKKIAKKHLFNQSIYYWIRMYKSGCYEPPNQLTIANLKKMKKHNKVNSIKYMFYYYGICYFSELLFNLINIGVYIRRKKY